MSYVAPDGNTYKYKYRINGYGSPDGSSSYYIIIYSNYKVCFCKEVVDVSHRYYYYTTAYKYNDGIVRLCGIDTVAGTKTYKNGYITGTNPGYNAYSYGSMGDNDDAFIWNWDCLATPSFAQTQTDFPIFDTAQEALAYVTEPEVFQIPSFSFSGSILPGQNSSLSQGSCSLASPYTTSFSFEGKCRELVSLKQLFYDKTGYTVPDSLVNDVKDWLNNHQTYKIYYIINTHAWEAHFDLYLSPPDSYFADSAGRGDSFYYKAPTRRWYYKVESTTVTTIDREWTHNTDGSSYNIFDYYLWGVVGGYGDYDY